MKDYAILLLGVIIRLWNPYLVWHLKKPRFKRQINAVLQPDHSTFRFLKTIHRSRLLESVFNYFTVFFPKDFTKCNIKKSLCELRAQVRIFEVHTHDSFLCLALLNGRTRRPVTKGAAKASRAKKILYRAILGCQSDQIAAASWSGNSDNQLSPNIRILFVQEV